MVKELKILFSKFFFITFICILILYSATIFFSLSTSSFTDNPRGIQETSYFDTQETNTFIVEFCPSNDCEDLFLETIDKASHQLYCSFFDLSHAKLIDLFSEKGQEIDVQIIVDNLNLLSIPNVDIFSDTKRNTLYDNYMHHKFCVIDEELVILGSANPTENGFLKNDNVIIVVNSSYLANNFLNEFYQLRSGLFGYHKKEYNWYNSINLLFENRTIVTSSYFCPQDDCMDVLIDHIDNAEYEILFASFALTYDELEESLENNEIRRIGIIEERFVDIKGSRIRELSELFPILFSQGSINMHHKFFVVDEEIVIVGSMNPSNSGAHYNDEFILVVKDREVAKVFKEEFIRLMIRESGQRET